MIGLDSNILIRFLTYDDEAQSLKATRLLSRLSAADQGFVSLIVLAETAWTLRRAYRYSNREVGRVLGEMIKSQAILVESAQEAFVATKAAEQDDAPLVDMLIGELARKAGCVVTKTFDEEAARLPGLELVT